MSESSFNNQPYRRRQRFDFDEFDKICRDALDEQMAIEGVELEEQELWAEHDMRPGEIGGVAITPLYREWFGDDLPPDDAA